MDIYEAVEEDQQWCDELALQKQQWQQEKNAIEREDSYPYEPRDREELVNKNELGSEKE